MSLLPDNAVRQIKERLHHTYGCDEQQQDYIVNKWGLLAQRLYVHDAEIGHIASELIKQYLIPLKARRRNATTHSQTEAEAEAPESD